MVRAAYAALLAATICLTATPGTTSEPAVYRGEYSLTYLGFNVARATFESRIDASSYDVRGSVGAAWLGALFDDTKGTLQATGRFSERGVRPELFRADYVSAKKPSLVDIRFAAGDVTRTTVLPPPRKRRNWVPLGPDDLHRVADPIAATLIKSDSLANVCRQSARMYDGELRADLTLSYVSSGRIDVPGYKGDTITCRMGFKPVSGYRKGRKALEFLRTKSRIIVAFAPLGDSGIYAPVHATIGTEIGTITVRARRFEAIR